MRGVPLQVSSIKGSVACWTDQAPGQGSGLGMGEGSCCPCSPITYPPSPCRCPHRTRPLCQTHRLSHQAGEPWSWWPLVPHAPGCLLTSASSVIYSIRFTLPLTPSPHWETKQKQKLSLSLSSVFLCYGGTLGVGEAGQIKG